MKPSSRYRVSHAGTQKRKLKGTRNDFCNCASGKSRLRCRCIICLMWLAATLLRCSLFLSHSVNFRLASLALPLSFPSYIDFKFEELTTKLNFICFVFRLIVHLMQWSNFVWHFARYSCASITSVRNICITRALRVRTSLKFIIASSYDWLS